MIRAEENVAGRSEATAGESKTWPGQASTYYDQPLLKMADWKWQIVLYFFLGGLAGGAYLVASLVHLFRLEKLEALIRPARYLSFGGLLACPVFLIWDLGKPARFYHMLRVLKLRSVMSIGSWAISIFGLFCGLTAAHQMANDGLLSAFPRLARILRALPISLIELPGMVFGLLVGSYTGVLLAATAVPIWARARHILGPLFLASGLSTALASLSCLLALGHHRHKEETLEALERAEIVSMTSELGLISALIPILGPLGKPLLKGRTGLLFTAGALGSGIVGPLLTRVAYKLAKKPMPHKLTIGTSLMALVGGLILRHVWISAGRTSAEDPLATHYYNSQE